MDTLRQLTLGQPYISSITYAWAIYISSINTYRHLWQRVKIWSTFIFEIVILNPSLIIMLNKSVDIGTQTSQGNFLKTIFAPPLPLLSILYMAAAPGLAPSLS